MKDARDHVAGAALAIRARNMNASKAKFRMVEHLHQGMRVPEVGLVSRFPDPLVHGKLRVEVR